MMTVSAAEGGSITSNPVVIDPTSDAVITYDGTGTNFANWTPLCHVYAWLEAKTGETFTKEYKTAWASCNGDSDYAALDAKLKMTNTGKGTYQITINIQSFFNVADEDLAKIDKLGIIVRAQYDGETNKTQYLFASVAMPGEPQVALTVDGDYTLGSTVTLSATSENFTGEVAYAYSVKVGDADYAAIDGTTYTLADRSAYTFKVTATAGEQKAEATKEVALAFDWYAVGSMNNWSDNVLYGLTKNDAGEYTITLSLDAGVYELKLKKAGTWDGALGATAVNAECSSAGYEDTGNIKFVLAAAAEVTIATDGSKICLTTTQAGGFGGEVVITSWTITGEEALVGAAWDPANIAADMTEADGVWTWTAADRKLTAKDYEYKVVANHAWGVSDYPVSVNNKLVIAEDGTYDIVFSWIPATETLTATATATKLESASLTITAPATFVRALGTLQLTANIVGGESAIEWTSGDTELATVSAEGLVTSKVKDANATVTITATAKDLDGVKDEITLELCGERDIYFTNNLKWDGTINAYAYAGTSTYYLGGWPGEAMTKVETNSFGEDIYKVSLPLSAEVIIFNNGSVQSANIALTELIDGNDAFYLSENKDDAGHYLLGGTYRYALVKKVETITLSESTLSIQPNSHYTISVTEIQPADATNKAYTWESDNEAVATVDTNGRITTLSVGEATISAVAQDGSEVKGNCVVTVSADAALADIVLNFKKHEDWGKVCLWAWTGTGSNIQNFFEAWPGKEITGADADGVYSYSFDANYPSVSIILNNGPQAEGGKTLQTTDITIEKSTCVIVTKTVDGEGDEAKVAYASTIVDCDTWAPAVISVESLGWYANVEPSTLLNVGDVEDVSIAINPNTATNQELTFESSTEGVVSGVIVPHPTGGYPVLKITALVEGTTTITITSVDNPEAKLTYELTVKEIPVEYYIRGYINNASYTGTDYLFVENQLKVTFEANSYLYIQSNHGQFYDVAEYTDWISVTTGEVTLNKVDDIPFDGTKIGVAGEKELTFNLVVNEDGSLKLSFSTPAVSTALENAEAATIEVRKVMENGTLYIIRDGEKYTATGILVK